MHTVDIVQFKEFKKGFTFDLMKEISMHKEIVKSYTFNNEIKKMSNRILRNILNSDRSKREKEKTILYNYILYLCNFMQGGTYKNFDKIYQYIRDSKHNIDYFNIVILKEIKTTQKITV